MLEFFHGWRRKAGCLALVLSLAFLGMWLRAYFATDEISVTEYGTTRTLKSGGGRLTYLFGNHNGMKPRHWNYSNWPSERMDLIPFLREEERVHYVVWSVAYWLLMIAPVLSSAYLILWKPRPKERRDA